MKPDISMGGARDVRPLVVTAQRGGVLMPADLLHIRETLLSARRLRRVLVRLEAQLPLLARRAALLEECPEVVDEIGRCINEQAEVVDEASPTLARVRRELRLAQDHLMERLRQIVASPVNAPFLQEPIITQRSGRFVIPLKSEARGRIPGLVHDVSASGATLFIEPLAIVEMNNRCRELQLEEEREVQRVLAALSGLVAENGSSIIRTVEILAELDLALAKARYAEAINASPPELVSFTEGPAPPTRSEASLGEKTPHPGSYLHLKRARHPLLDPTTVVPIDVHLGDDYFILVITGPNTGGKTVALKTVGLLCLMAQAGLHLPVQEGSGLSVFEGVYADIGDEQSIEQSLSTFSSHMTNIIRILGVANSRSLVLLDELGAGTDPVEGSALARALLMHLLERRITALTTTHYSELKIFAHATPGVENASVEFDVETLSPTYELTIGLPGRSNAFAIASRLGLNRNIVAVAQSLVSSENLETESLLAELKRARDQAQRELRRLEEARREAESLAQRLELRLTNIEAERLAILGEARAEARREVQAVREELKTMRRRLRQMVATAGPELPPPERAHIEARLDDLEAELAPLPPPLPPRATALTGVPAVGDIVWVPGLDALGEVVAVVDDELELRLGNFRLRTAIDEVELRQRASERLVSEQFRPAGEAEVAPPSPGVELHLRGQRVEQALSRLERYLDEAFLAGLPWVRIIHGKGTGRLRQAVREELARHPLVSSFRAADEGEGGDGVTVVTLTQKEE